MVVAVYVFVGNSGVLSFGQISFVAVGGFASGVMTIPVESKSGVLPDLFPILRDHTLGNVPSLVARGARRRRARARPRAAADAALGPGRRHRDVRRARDHAQRPARVDEDRPRRDDALADPRVVGPAQPVIGALVIIAIAYAYQRSRLGRMLRASREDAAAAEAVGVNVHRQRLWAFTLSGALAGFAGGLYVHMLGSITTDSVYLELTFLTLAMLVFGGVTSLWGAVVGALVVSGLDSFLSQAEQGIDVGVKLDLPQGTTLIILGVVMATMLILRPSGITGGREFSLPRARRPAERRPSDSGRHRLHEDLHRRLRRGRVAVRGQSRHARRRRGVGLRPLAAARRRDRRARPAADAARATCTAACTPRATRRRCRPASSASSRPRRCTPSPRSRRPRTPSPTAPWRRS